MKNVIGFLEERGFIDNITSDELKEQAHSSFAVYMGFDPTADSLHLGNLVGIIILDWMQQFGHTPIALIGGATGKIGDPSGKSKERPLLSPQILEQNIDKIKKQLKQYIKNIVVIDNDSWLSNCYLIDFLRDVGKHFRIGSMLGKESVRSRIQSNEGLSYTEFSYQVLQGYDFYYLSENRDVVLQIGGSDQWGNITAGVELARKLSGKTLYGLTYPLLERSDGSKYGKSVEGAIWLDPQKTSRYQFYQYLIRTEDAIVTQLLRMLTFVKLEEILEFERGFQLGSFISNAAQRRLAEEVTRYVHGEEGVDISLKVTRAIAPGSQAILDTDVLEEVVQHMPHVTVPSTKIVNQKYSDVALISGLVTSKGEALRLMKNGGAYLNNKRVKDATFQIKATDVIGEKYILLGAGKKKKVLVQIER